MRCNCGFDNNNNSKFCSRCGSDLSKSNMNSSSSSQVFNCSSCGTEVLNGSKFCPRCGYRFENDNKVVVTKNNDNTFDSSNEIVFMVISFIIPIFGICYYCFARNENPKVAKKSLIVGLISFLFRFGFEIIINLIEYII